MYLNFDDFVFESKFFKGKLNPRFWKDDKLNPEVREKLLGIGKDFCKSLKIEAPIDDIHLTGSLANFNWTSYSDLDVHVLLDFSKINKDKELVKKSFDGEKFMWNLRHPVEIKKHEVELYAQDIKEPHIASGLYSLLNDKWITKPDTEKPTVDEKDVNRKTEGYIAEIDSATKELEKAPKEDCKAIYERLLKMKEKIQKSRKEGLKKEGEFSVENLAFKQLRNKDYIEKLIDLSAKAYSKYYSMK